MLHSIPIKFFWSHLLLFQNGAFLGMKILKIWKNNTTAVCNKSFFRTIFHVCCDIFIPTNHMIMILLTLQSVEFGRSPLSRIYVFDGVLELYSNVKSTYSSKNMKQHKFWNFENLPWDGFWGSFLRFLDFFFNILIHLMNLTDTNLLDNLKMIFMWFNSNQRFPFNLVAISKYVKGIAIKNISNAVWSLIYGVSKKRDKFTGWF